MERLGDTADLAVLRQANVWLVKFLERSAGLPVQGLDREVEDLRQVEGTLQSVAPLLRSRLHDCEEPEFHQEFLRYRENLVRLQQELERLQSSAGECRARVTARQGHLQAAKAWCVTTREMTW
jgi:hypothetical protein